MIDYSNSKILLEGIKMLHDRARYEDRYFNEEDYRWMIGIELWEKLVSYARESIPFIIHDSTYCDNRLYGIKVELDFVQLERCQLFKEVKV